MATKRKQCHRFNDAGHAHALTFNCFQGKPFLKNDRSRKWLADAIEFARDKHQFHIWAYVFMPEHVHILIWPIQRFYDISKILASIKLPVTRRALRFVRINKPSFLPQMLDRQPNGNVHYRFWQRGGGYDRNVIEPATIWKEIEYIHNNPLRRGLCGRAEDWYWSSAGDYANTHIGPIAINKDSLPWTSQG